MGFIRDDKQLYDAILFTLITRPHSRFIASSTPGSKDNLFYKFCTDPKYGFSNHHVNWKDAVEPNGPLKRDTLEMIRSQLAPDPWRWRREMEAEFAENEDSFFPLSLITDAVDQSLAYTEFTEYVAGKRLFAGVDFGKHHDHSAIGVVELDLTTKMAKLIHTAARQLSHPSGTHDDQRWALALAWHGLREESRVPEYQPVVLTGYIVKPVIPYFILGKQPWKRDPMYNQTGRLCMACGTKRPTTVQYCPKCGSGSDGPNPAMVKP